MKSISFIVLLGLIGSACGGSSPSAVSPVRPTNTVTERSVTGTWSGPAADSGGQQQMGWTITQNGSTVTGNMTFGNSGRGMMGRGTLHGTWDGQTFTFRIEIPNGGFGGMMASCALVLNGQATLDEHWKTMMGTYAGQVSGTMPGPGPWSGSGPFPGGMMNQMQPCGGLLNSGQFKLTR